MPISWVGLTNPQSGLALSIDIIFNIKIQVDQPLVSHLLSNVLARI